MFGFWGSKELLSKNSLLSSTLSCRAKFNKNVKPIDDFLSDSILLYVYKGNCVSAGYDMLTFVDFTFAFYITV